MALDLDPATGGDTGLPEPRRPAPPRSWRERLDDLADATGVTPARLVVGALLLAGAAAGGWWLMRPAAAPVELSLPYVSTTRSGAAPPSSSLATVPTELVVHVAGAVVSPGVHRLPTGARVIDAVDAAGGLRGDSDVGRVNLAAPLADGARVYVPAVGEVAPPVAEVDAGAIDGAGGPLDLNTAGEEELDGLPGVGPATAAAIVEHRALIGRFTAVDQLLDVRGIGEAKLEQLRPLVRV